MIEQVRRAVCDHCGNPGPAALESEDPAELARSDGWILSSNRDETADLCPQCQEDRISKASDCPAYPCDACAHNRTCELSEVRLAAQAQAEGR